MPTMFNRRQYDEAIREIIVKIFSGRSISQSAYSGFSELFADSGWLTLGLPRDIQCSIVERSDALIGEDDSYAEIADAWIPLFDTLRSFGEESLYIGVPLHSCSAAAPASGASRKMPDEARALAATCRFDRRDFYAAEREGHFTTYEEFLVFGVACAWGMVSHWQSFTILGAQPDLISSYIKAAGGLDAVRRRFEKSLAFQLRSEKGIHPEDRFADRIVRALQWPSP